MSQLKTDSWTNANPAVARNINAGFVVTRITTYDITNGGAWTWTSDFDDASSMVVETGVQGTTNGFTPLSQSSAYGATISGFTNASPGVLTVNDTATFGFAAGDTIKVAELADDGADAALDLNRATYTIASLTGTTITLDQNTSSDNVYVSGGIVSRVSDTNGDAIPTENFSIRGITVGTTPVGASSAVMKAVYEGEEPVV